MVRLTCRWNPLCRTPWGTNRLPPGSLLQVWTNPNTNRLEISTSRDLYLPWRRAKVPTETEPPHSAWNTTQPAEKAENNSTTLEWLSILLPFYWHSHLADCICVPATKHDTELSSALSWKHWAFHKSCLQWPYIARFFSSAGYLRRNPIYNAVQPGFVGWLLCSQQQFWATLTHNLQAWPLHLTKWRSCVLTCSPAVEQWGWAPSWVGSRPVEAQWSCTDRSLHSPRTQWSICFWSRRSEHPQKGCGDKTRREAERPWRVTCKMNL